MRKRKKAGKLRRGIIELLDLPAEAVENTSRITVLGQAHMLLENHTGIFEYGSERIRIAAGSKMICVSGGGLVLRELSAGQVYIGGMIEGVHYE